MFESNQPRVQVSGADRSLGRSAASKSRGWSSHIITYHHTSHVCFAALLPLSMVAIPSQCPAGMLVSIPSPVGVDMRGLQTIVVSGIEKQGSEPV